MIKAIELKYLDEGAKFETRQKRGIMYIVTKVNRSTSYINHGLAVSVMCRKLINGRPVGDELKLSNVNRVILWHQ